MSKIDLTLSSVVSFANLADLLTQMRHLDEWKRKWTPAEAEAVLDLEIAMREYLINDKHHKRAEAITAESSFSCDPRLVLKAMRTVISEAERDTEWLHDDDERAVVAKALRKIAASLDR